VAQVEAMKALCGVERDAEGNEIPKGCANLQILGGNAATLVQPKAARP
jgi:hypothetical protein